MPPRKRRCADCGEPRLPEYLRGGKCARCRPPQKPADPARGTPDVDLSPVLDATESKDKGETR